MLRLSSHWSKTCFLNVHNNISVNIEKIHLLSQFGHISQVTVLNIYILLIE